MPSLRGLRTPVYGYYSDPESTVSKWILSAAWKSQIQD
ncbi:MAG: hypothetical protein OFPII_20120 [Osedax symbiont Rs1]|nr:MAG: hypothetical protein OFPII_20120 [Osedax symbiont Rs1]